MGAYEIKLFFLGQSPISIPKVSVPEVRNDKVLSGEMLENLLISRLLLLCQSQKRGWGGLVVLLVGEERFVVYRRGVDKRIERSLRFFDVMERSRRTERDSSGRRGWKDS